MYPPSEFRVDYYYYCHPDFDNLYNFGFDFGYCYNCCYHRAANCLLGKHDERKCHLARRSRRADGGILRPSGRLDLDSTHSAADFNILQPCPVCRSKNCGRSRRIGGKAATKIGSSKCRRRWTRVRWMWLTY